MFASPLKSYTSELLRQYGNRGAPMSLPNPSNFDATQFYTEMKRRHAQEVQVLRAQLEEERRLSLDFANFINAKFPDEPENVPAAPDAPDARTDPDSGAGVLPPTPRARARVDEPRAPTEEGAQGIISSAPSEEQHGGSDRISDRACRDGMGSVDGLVRDGEDAEDTEPAGRTPDDAADRTESDLAGPSGADESA